MKRILAPILALFLFPSIAFGDSVSADDLVKRHGLYYKEFTDHPFTGKTTGPYENVSYRDGRKHGPFVYYYSNKKVNYKGTYKDGKEDGPSVSYQENGQLWSKGTYNNGKKTSD